MPRKPKELTLRKIDLDTLINVLVNLYDAGANYIDISGFNQEEQDIIKITVRDEYLEELSEEEEGVAINKKLSDEDLNQLI